MIEITLGNVALKPHAGDNEALDLWSVGRRFGIFLASQGQLESAGFDDSSKCILEDVNYLINFENRQIQDLVNKGGNTTASYKFIIRGGGLLYLYFANCEAPQTRVSFDARIELYNVDSQGVRGSGH